VLWILGCVIYVLMVATGFLGYTLPWGQMSFWGATVITNLLGALPIIGEGIKNWLMGGFSIDQPTLNRFFSLHYLLPFVIAGVVVLHVWALHEETVPFTPHATMKDLFAVALFLLLFAFFVFFMPDALGHADNYIPANPLQTPPEIVPEWYLLPFYAILRAFDFNIGPIDSKLAGVLAMFASIGVLFVLPWLDTSKIKSMRYRPAARLFFIAFVAVCVFLGWCGGQNPGRVLAQTGDFSANLTWIEGGEVRVSAIHASGPSNWDDAASDAQAALTSDSAAMTWASRSGPSVGTAVGVFGGQERAQALQARTTEALEEQITAVKEQVGGATPFFVVERNTPFTFTVTRFSQALTLYYFLFFLMILPVLGLREKPGRVPDSITEASSKPQGAA
jgi:ubiquinol-cytochrome c reductase cytochrome b subunit